MENEDSRNAEKPYKVLLFVLFVFSKSMENVVAVIADNCQTNRAMARRIGPTFVGGHRHRFNICLQDIIDQHKDVLMSVQLLMCKLSYQIPAAKVQALIHLKDILVNKTRWSSPYNILRGFQDLLPFIKNR